ncbi:MAG: carbohydrate porin [Acidobacteriaceae bacterium]
MQFRLTTILLWTATAVAQTSILPASPQPEANAELFHHSSFHLSSLDRLQAFDSPAQRSAASSAPAIFPEEQEQSGPVVTMFPHPDSTPYWLSGQANSIFQAHGAFHSPYQGPNSLHGKGEYKASELATLYLGYQPHRHLRYNTDLIVDIENAGGRGLSQALGLAGETNLDVVRNPNLSSLPYLARGEIHQTIGLTGEMEKVAGGRGPFALATEVPVRRFEFRAGKMSVPDTFDINAVGSDSHLQFTNWTIDNNGAFDYAADTRGYTVGGVAEYDDRVWSVRYGIFAMPIVANGIDLDWAFSRARGQNLEYEYRKSLIPWFRSRGRTSSTRLLVYGNNAHMGVYREAVLAYADHQDATPTITLHEHFGALKYGFGFNTEQDVNDSLRLFGRFGWNEDQHESFAYTEVGQTILFGGDYNGHTWGRPADKFGIAFVTNAIKRDHQNYLKNGGLGFLLGDGRLNYAREDIVESYYTAHLYRGLFGALGLNYIAHPGYNQDRGPVFIPMARLHIDF